MSRVNFDETNKIWRTSDVSSVFNPNISMAHLILRSLQLNGSKIAQISDETGEQLTFQEIHKMTIRAAQNLQKRGFNAKQVFGIVCPNVTQLAPIVFASISMGCPLNVLDISNGKSIITNMFGMTKPSLIFCHVNAYDLISEYLEEIKMNVPIITFNGTKGNSEPVEDLFVETGIEHLFYPVELDGMNDVLAIMSSSGSSGLFKGVSLSHASCIEQASSYIWVNADDIFLNLSSIYWISGFMSILSLTITGATRIITTETFSPQLYLRLMQQYNVTVTLSASVSLLEILRSEYISKADISKIRQWVTAGFKIPSSVIEEFNSYLPNGNVNNAYGMTELSGLCAADFPICSGNDCVGPMFNGYSVKIIDDFGNRCGIDTNGELYIKPPFKFLGYYGNENLTKDVCDEDGFFMTGDIGRIDKNGNVYILDRKKDAINYYDWVFPADVEKVLLKSSEIKLACVVGVQDKSMLELPAAVVVRANESKITEEDIFKMVEDEMADYCKLRGGVYFVDSIPTTVSGKLLRREAKILATKYYQDKLFCDLYFLLNNLNKFSHTYVTTIILNEISLGT